MVCYIEWFWFFPGILCYADMAEWAWLSDAYAIFTPMKGG